ncbi:hypothetical protein F5141DRAFT_1065680 [Pisolithus sp. B1]|nr:hypothetical protein F5141DRAFT_1065680 [Pisolithus sp. B1]
MKALACMQCYGSLTPLLVSGGFNRRRSLNEYKDRQQGNESDGTLHQAVWTTFPFASIATSFPLERIYEYQRFVRQGRYSEGARSRESPREGTVGQSGILSSLSWLSLMRRWLVRDRTSYGHSILSLIAQLLHGQLEDAVTYTVQLVNAEYALRRQANRRGVCYSDLILTWTGNSYQRWKFQREAIICHYLRARTHTGLVFRP